MNWMFHHWILVSIFIVLVIVSLGVTAVLEAWLEFKKAPKEEMFWCRDHGYFRKKHCLPLFPELNGTAQNSFICPSCYYEKVFKNPNVRLN